MYQDNLKQIVDHFQPLSDDCLPLDDPSRYALVQSLIEADNAWYHIDTFDDVDEALENAGASFEAEDNWRPIYMVDLEDCSWCPVKIATMAFLDNIKTIQD